MVFYNRGKHIVMDPNTATGLGETPFDLLTDIIRVALMGTAYAINIDTHEQFDDISANEIVVTGYTARGDGRELGTKTITRNNSFDRIEFDAADLVFSAIGNMTNQTFDQIVIMREQDAGATDANTELIAHRDIQGLTTNGGDVTLQWNVDGILQLT